MTQIQAPTHCPSCDSMLEVVSYLLYCRSPSCEAQSAKKIQHFANTLKIKGLGGATISKLGITDINELYTLDCDTICELLSSEKLGVKLYDEIEKSKSATLNDLLPAFSIPLIGKTASAKISQAVTNVEHINHTTCEIAGLGEKATQNLVEWVVHEYPYYAGLPFNWKFTKVVQKATKGTVCISGKLKSYKTKTDAHKDLEALGYNIKSSITKDVTILVNESGIESLKTKKARESGITIVDNLQQFLLEN
jgi:NAD-dependent DNA ligase